MAVKLPIFASSEDRKLLDDVTTKFKEAETGRQQYERVWYQNLAFYFGRQWLQWTNSAVPSTGISRLYEPPAPPWRVRLVSNKIKPIIRKELAKIIKEKPQPFVIPASTDDDDLAAARAGEAIFEHLMRELGFNATLRQTVFWEIICGTAFIKDWYNDKVKDAQGLDGSIFVESVNPFQLYVADPTEADIEKQSHIIHVSAKSPEWVLDNYKVSVEPDSRLSEGVLESQFMSAMGQPVSNVKMVAVKEMWIKPCGKYPNGKMVTWAGDIILLKSDWPFDDRTYPFTKFEHVPTGRFYGDSVIVDLIPLQKEMNRTRSQIIESKNRMSKPQLIAPRGSVDPSKITTEPGLIIFYTPGFTPPQPIPLTSVPGYVIDEIARCQQDIDDISGQHEISKGGVPTGVSAATAISFLQEQDDAMISPTITSLEEGVGKIGRRLLGYVKQFWNAERTIRVLGENNTYEVFQFNRSSIGGNTDLYIQAGSATPRSTAAKQAFIMELMDKQRITPAQGMRYLDMAETTRMYEEMQVSERQAQRENLRMMQMEEASDGIQVTVNSWDEHDIHLQEHNMFRRRQAFERASETVKAAFEEHVQMHTQVLAGNRGTPIMPGDPLPPLGPDGAPAPPVGMSADMMSDPAMAGMNGNGNGAPPLQGGMQ